MELEILIFALLILSCFLIQYFLSISPFLSFAMVMYILLYFILEVCNFFFLIFLGYDTVKKLP